ncbi:AraC family transcriptional regulator [Paenibacillus psychroresistens]|uniref:AraC family transcriptional regulator n=1 Tax=Paenibacillus psychroresistens TaxID=1778678 RepID=A0A6B8RPS9_9BACL|nr:AraC family transcriptional regulator [Paenibacillus psychroresistens]QGQ97386.1 AraC family transcriptional regulator [Paenibacillus psychroresistens]
MTIELLPLRTNFSNGHQSGLPFTVYTVGSENQTPIARVDGFSANQLIITLSGKGIFRFSGAKEWKLLSPLSMLYIPASIPHEYFPDGEEPWQVAFISFTGKSDSTAAWGFGGVPELLALQDSSRLIGLISDIWGLSGLDNDIWSTTELLLVFLTELRKQSSSNREAVEINSGRPLSYKESIVITAATFLQDHMERGLTIAELSERFGYSQRQLTRLFRQVLGATPIEYLKRIRMQTAAALLESREDMMITQIALRIGMEPIYFTRMFKSMYGIPPSQYRNQQARISYQ